MYETVNLDVTDGAARIELNRPDSMNAWNKQFGEDLLAAVRRCESDDEVRAVLITGLGRGFSSGPTSRRASRPRPRATPTSRPRSTRSTTRS